jgi:muramoyltetrapeptide carboxypeptidase LdcA involved in peptidoglycan recycling
LSPKWLCGYSDATTLSFALTTTLDIATVHGSNFMNMGFARIDPADLRAFDAMSLDTLTQESAPFYGRFRDGKDSRKDAAYRLDKPSRWEALDGGGSAAMEGRVIGGCLDVLCKLIGTPYAPVPDFCERYRRDGWVWAIESCEMNAGDIYRTLWQMRECGWLRRCSGVLFGRPDGYSDTQDFTLADALREGLGPLGVPVIYGCDIGHIPPQMQLINGAYAEIRLDAGKAIVKQEQR